MVAVRAAGMAENVGMRIIGVVENMSYLVGTGQEIFGSGGGQRLADELGVPLLGSVPLDPALREAAEALFREQKLIKPVRLIGFGVSRLAGTPDPQLELFDAERAARAAWDRIHDTEDWPLAARSATTVLRVAAAQVRAAVGDAGKILARIYAEGFKVVGLKKLYMSKVEAEGFYYVHKERPFFGELTSFMSSGPCVVMVLEAAGARTQLTGVVGALAIAVLLVAAPNLLQHLPSTAAPERKWADQRRSGCHCDAHYSAPAAGRR